MADLNKLSVPLGRPDQEGREFLALVQAGCPRGPKGESVNVNTAAGGRAHGKRFQRMDRETKGARGVTKA